MVVGLLAEGVRILRAVRDDTAVVGETVLARVVGDGVVFAVLCALPRDSTEGDRQDQARYSPHFVSVVSKPSNNNLGKKQIVYFNTWISNIKLRTVCSI